MNFIRKQNNTLIIVASTLLLAIGVFHGSGINYLGEMVQASDVAPIVRKIFPVLFILPSLQLIGLALIGLVARRKPINHQVFFVLFILVLIDAMLAFWLGALIPGIILALPALIYLLAALPHQPEG